MIEASLSAWVWPDCVEGSQGIVICSSLAGAHVCASQDLASCFSGISHGFIPLCTTGLMFGCVPLFLMKKKKKKVVFHMALQTTCQTSESLVKLNCQKQL